MNKLTILKYQYLIKKYLKKGLISEISALTYYVEPEVYDGLTIKELTTLTDMAIKSKDKNSILPHLLLYGKNIDVKKIIENISACSLKPAILTKYLHEFMDIAINEERKSLIIHIARFLSNDASKYSHEIAIIKNYLLSHEVSYVTTSIAPLTGFYSAELEQKIITSEVKFVSDYLIKAPNKKAFFQKYYLTKPENENIRKIAHKFSISKNSLNREIYQYIVEIITSVNLDDQLLQSNHLFILYEMNKDYEDIDTIIYSLINLNVPAIINNLMQDLSEAKQDKICISFLEEKNTPFKYYQTLAITTDCKTTYKLIDIILLKDNLPATVDLIGNLKERFLSYTLNKVLNEKGTSYYLRVINNLYLLGYDNYLEGINFIFTYKLTHLFNPNVITNMSLYQESNLKRTRKM